MFLEHHRRGLPQYGIVFDIQDNSRLRSPGRPDVRYRSGYRGWNGFGAWEQNLKRRTVAQIARKTNSAAEAPDNAVDYRQTEAAAARLGAEERIKNPFLRF